MGIMKCKFDNCLGCVIWQYLIMGVMKCKFNNYLGCVVIVFSSASCYVACPIEYRNIHVFWSMLGVLQQHIPSI